ncbi:MAG TPA: hypothetical protein VMV05_07180 [bacterium]|nr:hypothetical protein [bacterium]
MKIVIKIRAAYANSRHENERLMLMAEEEPEGVFSRYSDSPEVPFKGLGAFVGLEDFSGAGPTVNLVPHCSQKLLEPGFLAPHFPHTLVSDIQNSLDDEGI